MEEGESEYWTGNVGSAELSGWGGGVGDATWKYLGRKASCFPSGVTMQPSVGPCIYQNTC